jgi:CHAD domain-containing protein
MSIENSRATAYICQIILSQIKILQEEALGARTSEDPEYVHQCRVASRRLRAALQIFSSWFSPNDLKKWNKITGKITKALGLARDKDVQIIFIKKWIIDHPTPGAKRFLLRLMQERVKYQQDVIEIANNIETGTAFMHFTNKISSSYTISSFSELSGEESFDNEIKPVLLDLTHKLLSHEIYVKDNPDENNQYPKLHEMRIMAKKLRYSLNLTNEAFDNCFNEEIKVVKNIQELLGDLHDSDVWISELPLFLKEEKELMIKYAGNSRGFKRISNGIDEIMNDRLLARNEIIDNFRLFWKDSKKKQVWKTLIDKINNAKSIMVKNND